MSKAEDYKTAAEESLAHAEHLIGKKPMTDRQFLESMARSDSLADHPDAWTETGTCGCCGMMICMAQTARDLLAAGDIEDGTRKWSEENRKRWEEGKYFQFYKTEKESGRDPHKSFEERGWEM